MCSRTAVRGALEDDVLPVRATKVYFTLYFALLIQIHKTIFKGIPA